MDRKRAGERLLEAEVKEFEKACRMLGLEPERLLSLSALLVTYNGRKLWGQELVLDPETGKKRRKSYHLKTLTPIERYVAQGLIRCWRRIKALKWYLENLDVNEH